MEDNTILNLVYGRSEKEPEVGLLGKKLLERAKRIQEEKLALLADLTEEERLILELRKEEDVGNLMWISIGDWYLLRHEIKEFFINNFNPLLFSGVFFKASDFFSKEEELASLIPEKDYFDILGDIKNNYYCRYLSSEFSYVEKDSEILKKLQDYKLKYKRSITSTRKV